jgi:chromosome segregation ATPase
MGHRFRLLFVLTTVLAGAGGCENRDRPNETEKVIEDTRDEAAETRADIQGKQEEIAREQGDVSGDREEFIAATEKKLEELDARIREVRASVQQRSTEVTGESRRDLDHRLAELETARSQAQSALENFRQATAEKAAAGRQATEAALERTRAAHDALRDRVSDEGTLQDRNPNTDMTDRNEPPSTAPVAPRGVDIK